MNDTTAHTDNRVDNQADGTWPGHDHHVPVPDTSMLPGTEQALPAAVELLHRATQGAHATIDSLADSAAPALQHLSERAACAEAALQAKANEWRESGSALTQKLRGTVSDNPLLTVAAAMALGAVLAHFTRSRR